MDETDAADASHQDLDRLVALFAGGDDSALRRLLERELPALRRHLEARTPVDVLARQSVSDTIQKAAFGLVRTRETLRGGLIRDFRRMLTVIAERVLVNTIEYERARKRDARRHASPFDRRASGVAHPAELAPATGPTPSQLAMKAEAIESLQRCFDRLSSTDQKILHLVDYEGRSYQEAAAELGVAYETAKKRYLRALGRLRELVRAAPAASGREDCGRG